MGRQVVYVARQLDRATPQPVRKMTVEGMQHFEAEQRGLAREVSHLL